MENGERGWQYNKVTGVPELKGLPIYRSKKGISKINFVLLLMYQTVKMVSSVAEGISVRCLKHRHMSE